MAAHGFNLSSQEADLSSKTASARKRDLCSGALSQNKKKMFPVAASPICSGWSKPSRATDVTDVFNQPLQTPEVLGNQFRDF